MQKLFTNYSPSDIKKTSDIEETYNSTVNAVNTLSNTQVENLQQFKRVFFKTQSEMDTGQINPNLNGSMWFILK